MEIDPQQLLVLAGSLVLSRLVNKAVDGTLAVLKRWWRGPPK